jgi:hypothetical protein
MVGWAKIATPCLECVFVGVPQIISAYGVMGIRGLRTRSECIPGEELEECSVEISRVDRNVEA